MNSNCPTSQDKRSQPFLIVLWYNWVYSLPMLLVWKGSKTSHHLDGKCQIICSKQNFITLSSYLQSFCNHNGHQLYTTMMKKDVPRYLAPVVVKYYIIQDLHTSLKLEVTKFGINREILTSNLMLHCCVKSLLYYSTTLSQCKRNINKPITAHNCPFLIWCRWTPHLLLFYYLMLYYKITNTYCYQTFSVIICDPIFGKSVLMSQWNT